MLARYAAPQGRVSGVPSNRPRSHTVAAGNKAATRGEFAPVAPRAASSAAMPLSFLEFEQPIAELEGEDRRTQVRFV